MSRSIAAKAELRQSLLRLVKGLSALFWGLPLALLVCAQTSLTTILRPFGVLPALATTGMLYYGVIQLGGYQRHREAWTATLNHAKLFGILCVGLSPFVFLWSRLPWVDFYSNMMGMLGLAGLLFLFCLNRSLKFLTDMLPDEGLREETHLFTSINLGLIVGVLILSAIIWLLREFFQLPRLVILRIDLLAEGKRFLMLFFVLLPLAMTMTLLWKIKEAALAGIFEQTLNPAPVRKDEAEDDAGVDTDFILQAREPSPDRD